MGQITMWFQQIGSQTGEIMKRNKTCGYIFLIFVFLISACDLIQIDLGGNTPSKGITTVLITHPPDGTHFQVGQTINIQSEVAISSKASGVYLMVNGLAYYYDQFYQQINDFHISQPWMPKSPGEYFIYTIVEDDGGIKTESNTILIIIDGAEDAGSEDMEVDETLEPSEEECPDPNASTHSYANCRSGPGTAYEIVEGLRPGQSFLIVGKSTSGTWWQVERNSSGATCWIWTKLVDICGDTDDVTVVGVQEKDEVIEEEAQVGPNDEPPAAYTACHDYPDFGICTSDPEGFGGCSWDTGQSKCVP